MSAAGRGASQVDADDVAWMREAVLEGARGLGITTPNPAVGCVLVRGGREVARGHYRGAGGPHAEAVALAAAGKRARGATAYVTLEPHAHQGRTPPCTDALIRAGVARVVVGCIDPNAVVSGRGVRQLRGAGLDVVVGVLEAECADLIRGFSRFVRGQGPLVHLKVAATLDGRIAAASRRAPKSAARARDEWISGPASRAVVQEMRARAEAILVGVGTVLADDPRLTCRRAGAPTPLRVVLDPRLETPPGARVVTGSGRALVVGAASAPASRRRRRADAGGAVALVDTRGKRGWRRLLALLADRGVMELLVEGGARVAGSAVAAGVVNRVSIFYNPRLLGGDAVAMIAPFGVRSVGAAPRLTTVGLRTVGDDLLWELEMP